MSPLPQTLDGVGLTLKANVYFDGGVISHTVKNPDGRKQTLGIIRPGTYRFDTQGAERMDIIAGSCRVKHAGEGAWVTYGAGQTFRVPAKSFFEIAVDSGLAEYLCSFE
jgi:uncharacterized protein YaiE (UPF0345 family)